MADKDYRKFKTPFYEIQIGDSKGNNMIKLPHSIARLIEKVEIVETFADFSTINITFAEGSREPANINSIGGKDTLYKLDKSIGQTLTNKTGMLTDLKFGGKTGITFTTESDINSDKQIQTVVDGTNVVYDRKKDFKSPQFLFQERNQVMVTWGYLEDSSTIRSVRGYIFLVKSTFPENGMPKTTITCQDTRVSLDQISPGIKGIPFGKRTISSAGNFTTEFDDPTTDELIKDICNKAGIPCIVSTNLPAAKLDKNKQKVWLGGQSFDQFMVELAKQHNAVYKVLPNPKTGVDTLIFINKKDFDSTLICLDPDLFRYKYPGSILKNVDINVDFGPINRTTEANIDQEGKSNTTTTADASSESVLFTARNTGTTSKNQTEQILNLDSTATNPIVATESIVSTILDGNYTGHLKNTPIENIENNLDSARINAEVKTRTIQLDFTSLGYTQLTPGTLEILGIGLRYSGKYRVLTVTHTLDNRGYNCRGSAESGALTSGGVQVPEAKIANTPEAKVDSKLFTPKDINLVSKIQSANPREDWGKFNQTR